MVMIYKERKKQIKYICTWIASVISLHTIFAVTSHTCTYIGQGIINCWVQICVSVTIGGVWRNVCMIYHSLAGWFAVLSLGNGCGWFTVLNWFYLSRWFRVFSRGPYFNMKVVSLRCLFPFLSRRILLRKWRLHMKYTVYKCAPYRRTL